jgi:hypothetical protein
MHKNKQSKSVACTTPTVKPSVLPLPWQGGLPPVASPDSPAEGLEGWQP